MIGGRRGSARFDVDLDLRAFVDHRRGREDMIDAPSLIFVERAGAQIIPQGKLLPIGVKLPEDIHKSTSQRLFRGATGVFMVSDMLQVFLGAVDVDRFGCDIHVPTPYCRTVGGEMFLEIHAETRVPAKLIRIFR